MCKATKHHKEMNTFLAVVGSGFEVSKAKFFFLVGGDSREDQRHALGFMHTIVCDNFNVIQKHQKRRKGGSAYFSPLFQHVPAMYCQRV